MSFRMISHSHSYVLEHNRNEDNGKSCISRKKSVGGGAAAALLAAVAQGDKLKTHGMPSPTPYERKKSITNTRQNSNTIFVAFMLLAFFSSSSYSLTNTGPEDEIFYIMEPFDSMSDQWFTRRHNDKGKLNLTVSTSPDSSLFGNGALRVEYQVAQTESWGGFVDFGWILNSTKVVHNCNGATHLSLWFKILEKQSLPDRVHLRLIMMDDSDCLEGHECAAGHGSYLENYYSFHYILGGDNNIFDGDSQWQEVRIELRGDDSSDSPFLRTGSTGSIGNNNLDAERLRGWRIELSIDSQGDIGSVSEGVVLLDQLACVGGGDLLGAAFHPKNIELASSDQEGLLEQSLREGTWFERYYQSDQSRHLSEALLTPNGTLSMNFTIEQAESWGGFLDYQHLAPGNAYYNLSQSTYMSLKYYVSKAAMPEGRAHLRIILMDGSDCTVDCDMYPGQNLENYYSFNYMLGDDSSDPWSGEITLALEDGAECSSPFLRTGWTGIVGNNVLDSTYIKGFRLELNVDSQGDIGSLVSGIVALKDLNAFSQYNCSNAPHYVKEADLEFNAFDGLSDFRKIEFIAGECGKTCQANADCMYAFSDELHCFVASYLDPNSVGLLNTELKSKYTSYWMDDISKRGDFCTLCTCHESDHTIDCRGQDLAILPKTFSQPWTPYILDLRNNARLCIIGSGALSAISDNLKELKLPTSMRHISNQTIMDLETLENVSFEDGSGVDNLNNVISSSSGFFGDKCCGPGAHLDLMSPSDGFTFCNMKVDTPGIDAYMDPFWQYVNPEAIYTLMASSSFMAEAAESPEKCAEYCAITEQCNYFSYDARRVNSEPRCNLLKSNGTSFDYVCCKEDAYGDDEQSIPGWTSGRPPRTRHSIDNARVLVNPQAIELDSSNDYKAQFSLSLGSMPLRGGVWIEPEVVSDTDTLVITVSPKRVALYDNRTVVIVTIEAVNADTLSSDETVILSNGVDSCDTAFMLSNSLASENSVYIDVVVSSGTNYLLAFILAPLSIAVLFALVYIYIDYKKRMGDLVWSVKRSELKFDEPPEIVGRGTFGLVLLAEYRGTQVAVKRVIPPDLGKKRSSIMDRALSSQASAFSSGSVIFKGFDSGFPSSLNVNVKEHSYINGHFAKTHMNSKTSWNWSSNEYSKKDFIREMRYLSKLRHPCITTIMGAVIARKEEPMLVMEYMDHGSLYDVLQNKTMIIEGEHVLPILRDITHGLRFLHAAKPQVIHGDLKTQNILVDSRFRAKVTDFGLSKNKEIGGTGTPYWMAPELLRGESQNTTASDVYSFGILLYEVYSRREPYEGEDYMKILQDVADPSVNKRPPIPPACPQDIQSFMSQCLKDNPSMRPSFESIDMKLREFDITNVEPGKLRMSMQKVEKEKKLTDSLLYNVFPQHVAIALRDGSKVEPETRQIVTIFFSDIVGFTNISSSLSAMKVSDMLDRLYSKFDALSIEHDIFKVETIGDAILHGKILLNVAYMAATNLVKDQKNHVSRIAQFSIAALGAAKTTLIDIDNPEMGFVNIRVGFHSGPVVANVVGSRNPRYCLFGDSVNTASRMESNSEQNRIHCSERSAKLLRIQNPEIRICPRGKIEVKGKGEMATYWINEGSLSRRMNWINENSSRRMNGSKRMDSSNSKKMDPSNGPEKMDPQDFLQCPPGQKKINTKVHPK